MFPCGGYSQSTECWATALSDVSDRRAHGLSRSRKYRTSVHPPPGKARLDPPIQAVHSGVSAHRDTPIRRDRYAILQKPERLTEEEYEVMKTHAPHGHSILFGAELFDEAHWVLRHHERIDGQGYPDGLSGDAIPLESRIILVAAAFEAMTSDRPYRRGRAEAEALDELRSHGGTQFDPEGVAALACVLRREPRAGRRGENLAPVRRRASGRRTPVAPKASHSRGRSRCARRW